MKKIEKIYKENVRYMIPLIIVVAFLAKLIQHFYLPAKYYYDNNRILSTINDPRYAGRWGGAYEVAADFFRNINIFHFTTMLQWSIFLGILFNIFFIILFLSNRGLDFKQTIFALMYTGILNIYIYNVGKDTIQLLIFTILFIIINLKIKNWIKIVGCFFVLFWESTFYRDYYIIIAFFFLCIVLGICFLRKKNVKVGFIKGVMILLILYAVVFVFLGIARESMPEDYDAVMVCKENTTQLGADTTIDDKIAHEGKLLPFMANYVINSFRMAIPYELLKSGIYYLPFVAFEIFLIYYLVKAIFRLYKMDFKQILALSAFIAYFMGSVLFEPDFGSFVRHEAATFPVLYILIFNQDNWSTRKINYHREEVKTINERINPG